MAAIQVLSCSYISYRSGWLHQNLSPFLEGESIVEVEFDNEINKFDLHNLDRWIVAFT